MAAGDDQFFQGVKITETVLGEGHSLNSAKDFPDVEYNCTHLHPHVIAEPERYPRIMSNTFNALFKSLSTGLFDDTFQVKITYKVRRYQY